MSSENSSLKSIYLALGANFAISIAKFFAALKTGSGSMMAEAIHSISDCINQILLLVGLKKSKTPPNNDFPLGHGKEIYFYSFIVSILIFTLGGVFSLYEGYHKLNETGPLTQPGLAIGVLIFAFIAEGLALIGCLKEIKKIRGKKSLFRWLKETRKSQLVVILGEDSAALLGLTIAIVAIGLTALTGNPVYDALGSMTIGALLILVSILLGKEIKDLLIGRGVEASIKQEYTKFINENPNIDKVLNLLTMHMGDDVLVAMKVHVSKDLNSAQMVSSINKLEKEMKQKFPEIVWLFVEPDIHD